MGSDAYRQALREDAVLEEFAKAYTSDPCFRKKVNDFLPAAAKAAYDVYGDDPNVVGHMYGRVLVGGLLFPLGIAAAGGDFWYYLEKGTSVPDALLMALPGRR